MKLLGAYMTSLEVLSLVSYCFLEEAVQWLTWVVFLPRWSRERHFGIQLRLVAVLGMQARSTVTVLEAVMSKEEQYGLEEKQVTAEEAEDPSNGQLRYLPEIIRDSKYSIYLFFDGAAQASVPPRCCIF